MFVSELVKPMLSRCTYHHKMSSFLLLWAISIMNTKEIQLRSVAADRRREGEMDEKTEKNYRYVEMRSSPFFIYSNHIFNGLR